MKRQQKSWDTGTGLAGHCWEATDPRAVVLLQHGLGEYSERYVSQYGQLIPRLVASGISAYAIDLKGHGRSAGPRATVDVRDAVRDHLAARRKLQELGLPIVLFGHSLGGLVTASSAAQDPAHVHGVILSSPALLLKSNAFGRAMALLLANLLPGLPTVRLNPADLCQRRDIVDDVAADPLMHHGRVRALSGATMLAVSHEAWDRYPHWQLPVLVFHGTRDTYTDPAGSRRFFETIPAQDKTLRMVEGGYHELLNDQDGEDILRLIMGWLDQRIPAAVLA
jgi:alpha-beta hydrolase superfamily lysophospholipase